MLKLGIIGAENSHSYCIAKICNVLKKVPMRVTHIWGETEVAAKASAQKGAIPHIVSDWRDLLGAVDGVMIDHRNGANHYEPAKYFIARGVPTFIDKPMTLEVKWARELFTLAEKKKTPVCTFSAIPQQRAFRKFAAEMAALGNIQSVNTTGSVDLDSIWGGVFFYGIHQVDALVELIGTEAKSAFIQRNGKNAVATILFANDRIATMNCIATGGEFHWRVCTDKEAYVLPHRPDKDLYLASAKLICQFLRDGSVPWSKARMLAPIAILEALQASLRSGKPEKVALVS